MRTVLVAVVLLLSACNCASVGAAKAGPSESHECLDATFMAPEGVTLESDIVWACANLKDGWTCLPQDIYEAVKLQHDAAKGEAVDL